MSRAWLSFKPKPTKLAPRPRRLRQRDKQPIPRDGDVFNWRPEVELIVELPKASSKAKERRHG